MAKQYQSVDPTLLALNTAKSVLPQTKKQVPASPTTPATSQRPAFTTTPPLQAQSKTFGGITPPFNSPIGASTPQQIGETQQQINSLPKEMPATGTKKLSVDEFAESIKQKYPEYADRDNKTLAEAMLKKYPQYNDRVEVGTPGFEGLVKTVIGDKTPLQAFITPAVRFARGIADVGAGIQEGIDTGLSKIGLIPSQEAKNKQARAKDEAITQQILGDKGASESVIQEGGRVAGSMIANAPAGKLGTAGKMALGATEGLLGGATYNLSTGEGAGSPINLGLSTALGAAIPGVGALARGIAEKTPALKNTMAKRLLNSGIKITDTNKKAIVKASGKERTDLALENDIVGSVDDMITKTDEMVDNAMEQKLSTLQSINETTPVTQTEKLIANSVITQAKRDLEELYGKAFDQITDAEKVPELQDVFNIVNNLQKTIDGGVITPAQKEALKSLYDAYNSHLKYDPAKNRILSGAEKIRLSLQKQIEEIGNKVGVDIKGLNKKIAGGYALKKGLIQAGNRMDNLNMFGLSDSQTAILSAALGGSPLQVASAIVGKGLLESIPVKSKLAKSLYTKGLNELTSNIPTNRPTARSNISSQFASSNPPSIGGKADDVKFPIRLKQEGMQTKGATLPKPTVKTPPVIAETGKIGVPYKVLPKTTNKPVGLKANDSKPKVDVFKRFTELDNNDKMEKVNPYNGNYRGDFKGLETEYGKIDSVKFDGRGKPTEFMIDGTIHKPSDIGSYYREKGSKEIVKTAIESKYDSLRSEINKIKKGMGPQAMNLQSILDEFGIDTVSDIPDGALEEILKMTRARKMPLPKLGSKGLPKLGKEVLEQDISNIDDSLIQEAKKYKSTEDFVNSYMSSKTKPFEDNIDNIENIQYLRHEMHTFNANSFYKSGGPDFGKYETIIDDVIDSMNINITNTEKDHISRLESIKSKIEDLDTDYEGYSSKDEIRVFKEASDLKEKANDIIESYLQDLEKKYISEGLAGYNDDIERLRERAGSFAPSGYARARSILGDGTNNTAIPKRYDVQMSELQLKKIREQANKKPLPPLPKKGK